MGLDGGEMRGCMNVRGPINYSTCLAGSLWAIGGAGESGTAIGVEEGSRKGKCGGGEALEAVEAHGAFTRRYHFHISLHTLRS
jgi:hypothetical protein